MRAWTWLKFSRETQWLSSRSPVKVPEPRGGFMQSTWYSAAVATPYYLYRLQQTLTVMFYMLRCRFFFFCGLLRSFFLFFFSEFLNKKGNFVFFFFVAMCSNVESGCWKVNCSAALQIIPASRSQMLSYREEASGCDWRELHATKNSPQVKKKFTLQKNSPNADCESQSPLSCSSVGESNCCSSGAEETFRRRGESHRAVSLRVMSCINIYIWY